MQRPTALASAAAAALVLLLLGTVGVVVLNLGGPAEPRTLTIPQPTAVQSAAAAGRIEQQGASRSSSRPRVDPDWAARTGTAAGIPVPAVQAYGDAELTLRREQPGCRLSWTALAGLGWVESQHGTIDDRTLGPDGYSSTPVVGPALDGEGFAAIRPTSQSTGWHGDAEWEHAVGPLQFIASTWERWGADGDGDGLADPLDLDDAALAAGRYLCADAHDLATTSGWNAAIHSYNHDRAYVVQVSAAANTYAERTRRS